MWNKRKRNKQLQKFIDTYWRGDTKLIVRDADMALKTVSTADYIRIAWVIEAGCPAKAELQKLHILRLDGEGDVKPSSVNRAISETVRRLVYNATGNSIIIKYQKIK